MPIEYRQFRKNHADRDAKPWLGIEIENPHTGQKIKCEGLIDTGASECCFPEHFADMLGHDFRTGEKINLGTASGATDAYMHTTIIHVPGFSTNECKVSFVKGLKIPLLGVKSFLSNFILTIDYPKETFSLKLPVK
jgi:predicted aspartyl protease